MNQTINDLSRIKWRCRRGTKELDFLLLNYFNQKYKAAAEEDQRIFLDLLELQDPKLIAVSYTHLTLPTNREV